MTRLLIWFFKAVISITTPLPNQEQAASSAQFVENAKDLDFEISHNKTDCNTFKSVADPLDSLL